MFHRVRKPFLTSVFITLFAWVESGLAETGSGIEQYPLLPDAPKQVSGQAANPPTDSMLNVEPLIRSAGSGGLAGMGEPGFGRFAGGLPYGAGYEARRAMGGRGRRR